MCGRVCRARDIRCAVGVVAHERCLVGVGHDLSSCATLFSTRGSDVHCPSRLVHLSERLIRTARLVHRTARLSLTRTARLVHRTERLSLTRTARLVHRTERLYRPATLAVTARVSASVTPSGYLTLFFASSGLQRLCGLSGDDDCVGLPGLVGSMRSLHAKRVTRVLLSGATAREHLSCTSVVLEAVASRWILCSATMFVSLVCL